MAGSRRSSLTPFLFYTLSLLALYGAVSTVFRKNPITCALHLALTMAALAGLFFNIGAYFIAGVQLVVYAGAVMVLFVMVVMLFDDKKTSESKAHTYLPIKIFISVFMFGVLSGVIPHSTGLTHKIVTPEVTSTKSLASVLFSDYVLFFEWIGVLLLIVAVGVVLLNRSGDL